MSVADAGQASQNRPRLGRKDLLASVLLACLVVVFFHNALLGGEQFYAGDTYRFFYPLKKMVAESVRAGEAPVWNPLVHSGMPLHAALQGAVFYPLSILLYVLPFDFAFKWYVALHALIAALGTYFLLRRWRLDRVPAALAGITYAFSGYVISFIDGLNIFSSIVWLPVVFALFERAVERPRPVWIIAVSLAVAVQMLAGDPVSAYFTLLVCGAYWMTAVAGSAFRRRPRRETLAVVLVLPATAILTGLLCYAQLGPSQELTLYSTRAAPISYAVATWHSLDPLRLLTLIVPYLFGNPLENVYDWGRIFSPHFPLARSLYFGAMPIALIPVAIIAFKERRVYFFAGVFLISLLLSLGGHAPLYKAAYLVLPMLAKFRYPIKCFFVTTFAAAVLFGYGLQYMLSEDSGGERRVRQIAAKFSDMFSTVLLAGTLAWVAFALCDKFFFDLTGSLLIRISSADPLLSARFVPYMKREMLQASVMFALLSACLYVWRKGPVSRRLIAVIASAFVVLDTAPTNYRAMDTAPESFYTPSNADSLLRADGGHFRLYRTPLDVEQRLEGIVIANVDDYYMWNRELLSPNFGTLFGHGYTDGYESANLLWHNLFLRFVEGAPPIHRPRLLGVVNVKYIFSSRPVNHPDLKLRSNPSENVFIYENAQCLDRAYFVPDAVVAPDELAALRLLASEVFDPRKAIALVNKGGPGSINPQPGIGLFQVLMPPDFKYGAMDVPDEVSSGSQSPHEETPNTVIFTGYSANSVTLDVDAPTEGYVVLSDAYYPRWQAYVNGEKVEVLRANCTVRAVPVAKGNNSVEFIYDTTGFRKSAFISLGALVLCVLAAAFDLVRRSGRRRRERTGGPDERKQERE